MKKSTLILFILLFSSACFAQAGRATEKDIKEFISRKSVVVLKEGYSKDVIEELSETEPDVVRKHIEKIDKYNMDLLLSIKSHSLFENKKVEMLSGEEIRAISNREDYIVIFCSNLMSGSDPSIHKQILTRDIPTNNEMLLFGRTNFVIFFLEETSGFLKKPLYLMTVRNTLPNRGDIIAVLDFGKIYFNYKLNKKSKKLKSLHTELLKMNDLNASKLKNMSLAFNRKDLDDKISNEGIGDLYPWPHVIIDDEEFERILSNREQGVAYWYSLLVDDNNVKVIFSTSGEIISYIRPKGGGIIMVKTTSFWIGKKHIQRLVEYVNN